VVEKAKGALVELRRCLPDLRLAATAFAILVMLFSAATLTPMSGAEAEEAQGFLSSYLAQDLAVRIFLNNLLVALLSEVPFLGPPILGYIIYDSGRFVGWQLAGLGVKPHMAPLLVLATTLLSGYGLLEFMGYALTVAKSIQVSRRLVGGLLRKEGACGGGVVRGGMVTLLVAALLLALGAWLEARSIEASISTISNSS